MSLREAAEFVPEWEPADQISLFSILGGIPYYLSMCQGTFNVSSSPPSALLQEEREFLLRSEVNEPRRYASITAAIADGATKPSKSSLGFPG